jgi:hypothetical protein
MVQEGIDQGVGRMARRRVNDQSSGLVKSEQIGVLIEYVQRDLLGQGHRRLGGRPGDANDFPCTRVMGGFGGAAIDADMPFGQEALNGSARNCGELSA